MPEKKPSEPEDYAETLKKFFTTVIDPTGEPTFKMSERHRQQMEKIRKLVTELRGG